jgi:3-hydroxyisobutyrate dehydrogenase-like beta-hydroxyacid dehydrogenase
VAAVISLIGFGEAAQAFAGGAGWAARGFDIANRQADFARLGVTATRDNAATITGAALILCLVTAGSAFEAARDAAPHLSPGALWCDMNSVAPATKRAAAALIGSVGGRYVDCAVMSPVQPLARAVPVLLAGPHAAAAADALGAAGFANIRIVAGHVGSAAAIKMVRSVMVKGIEALTAECLLAAHRAGVTAEVLASLGPEWAAKADYNLDRMLAHGTRRADEMDEVVATLNDLGVDPLMSRGTAARQRTLGATGTNPDGLAAKLDLIDPEPRRRAA